jgi:ribosomal protein S4E
VAHARVWRAGAETLSRRHGGGFSRVKQLKLSEKGVPVIVTHDGRTIRYPDPLVRVLDTVMVNVAENKIMDFAKFELGNLVMVTGGRNTGRCGVVAHREKHKGAFDICHIKDANGAPRPRAAAHMRSVDMRTLSLSHTHTHTHNHLSPPVSRLGM